MKKPNRENGYMTVFLSLILMTVIAVVLSSMEAIRVSAIRMQAETACQISAQAYMSQYNRSIKSRYGLLMVERGGEDLPFLKSYISENCGHLKGYSSNYTKWFSSELASVTVTDQISVADEDFGFLKAQIIDYMKYYKGEEYLGQFVSMIKGSHVPDTQTQKEQLSQQLTNSGKSAQQQVQEYEQQQNESQFDGKDTDETQISQEGSNEGATVKDPRKSIAQMLKSPILNLIMEGNVSDAQIDPKQLSNLAAPEPVVDQIRGFDKYSDITDQLDDVHLTLKDLAGQKTEDLVIDCYIGEFFKNASDGMVKASSSAADKGKLSAKTALQYEIEYMISGQSSDALNLKSVINRLIFFRMILNITHIYNSSSKVSAARGVAAALSSMVLMPFLTEIITLLIICAWSYAEAIVDCKTLIRGGMVPVLKSDGEWNLSLERLAEITVEELDQCSGAEGHDKGLSYENYLTLFMLMTPQERKISRMLNLMEANVRLDEGEDTFSMSNCAFGITVCADFEFNPFFMAGPFNSEYVHHVLRPVSY